ncbi:hypothetical protein C8Q73DRAFT_351617 [Cubamyces lactineus]|nr:hypothetical protein C8Q73DRAFT_351617 [Cubamyces lactineus]
MLPGGDLQGSVMTRRSRHCQAFLEGSLQSMHLRSAVCRITDLHPAPCSTTEQAIRPPDYETRCKHPGALHFCRPVAGMYHSAGPGTRSPYDEHAQQVATHPHIVCCMLWHQRVLQMSCDETLATSQIAQM